MLDNGLVKNEDKKQLKYTLNIYQTASTLVIRGEFNRKSYQAVELWIQPRGNTGSKIQVGMIKPTYSFEFEVSLNKIINIIEKNEGNIINWFVKVTTPVSKLSKKRIESKKYELTTVEGESYAAYFIRIGRFQYTTVNNLNIYTKDEVSLTNYITVKGNLSSIIHTEPKSRIINNLQRLEIIDNGFCFYGILDTGNFKVNQLQLIAKGRSSKQKILLTTLKPTFLDKKSKENYGLHYYSYDIVAPLDSTFINSCRDNEIYDLYLELYANDCKDMKITRLCTEGKYKNQLKDFQVIHKNKVLYINPYLTFKQGNLSFHLSKISRFKYVFINFLLKYAKKLQYMYRNREIWLIGERVDKAQDNGYVLFKHIRMKYPKEKVYYVIKKGSPEKQNVAHLGQVVNYQSLKHIWLSLVANNIVTSHHHELIYPLKVNMFKEKMQVTKYYLGHGVKAMKNVVKNYGKNAADFHTDYMIVSSEKEKEIVIRDYGYQPTEVLVTGMPRFDTLFNETITPKKQLLIIPTWRNWLLSEELFFESDFFRSYSDLLNEEALHDVAKNKNMDIVFCMHVNMLKYNKYFQHPNVRTIIQGEENVQDLIKESALMITDYSSVAFDHAFLNKPVIFYQFDRARFLGNAKVHINFEQDLPGEIVNNDTHLLQLIKEYENRGFQIKKEYKERANRFIQFKDQQSSERVYQVVKSKTIL